VDMASALVLEAVLLLAWLKLQLSIVVLSLLFRCLIILLAFWLLGGKESVGGVSIGYVLSCLKIERRVIFCECACSL